MIMADNGATGPPPDPLRGQKHGRIKFETTLRIGMNIAGRDNGADQVSAAEQKPAALLYRRQGHVGEQLLQSPS